MKAKKIVPPIIEGVTFGGFLKKRNLAPVAAADGDGSDRGQKYLVFKVTIVGAALILLARLGVLTIIEGAKNRQLAEQNRIRLTQEEAPRGKIFDRGGVVLATSEQKFSLEKDGKSSEISGEQAEQLIASGLAGENFSGDLGRIRREVVRIYPQGETSAHLVGYTSVVGQEDLVGNRNLTSVDFVGRLGVEETYDSVLRGKNGARLVEVDAQERIVSLLATRDAQPGSDITLSLDSGLQKKVYEQLSAQIAKIGVDAGAAVVTDVKTGEVLALVSIPSFDPADVGSSIVSPLKPIFNRAVSGTYTPGSVFKIVSAVAGLESGKITPGTEIEDVGEFSIGEFRFANWYWLNYSRRDGVLKIDRAIARSNDIFFYRLGERVGLDGLRYWAVKFGLGQKTGIDLSGEAHGLIGDQLWKSANVGEDWFLGDTLHLAIGQGFIATTPLQVNVMTSIVANGGKKIIPHLTREGKVDKGGQKVSDSTLAVVKSGMRMACEKGGTAWPFFNADYSVGCKTGTAEKAQGNPHAWFTAFAPFDDPQVAITVIVEDGGEGSSVAAPVAKEVLDWWFENR